MESSSCYILVRDPDALILLAKLLEQNAGIIGEKS